ncbi:S-adenosyl-L-methionine-dependent methyltransferase [Trichoderma citrinoviride]|uniref:S-adenosyl-L-methionine-dependent methyltransferase n=1 Tax=Trichoderma citrinoviride TaxID=58853 RepID=A0A2T4AXR3_9HYPO|nr:S-adenosyl-L-methionine-dependent methyltransferase [Trichoderma citrinoviride]PTB61865.1 S-adenosyl-L-methionine-dependent methyltransferase [Trichoderma citrinoviride]
MAQTNLPSYYARGHSDYTIATHLRRKAETDAAFLLPYIKLTDHILDVGCGPGTITTSLAKYAPQGTTIGVDISPDVLQKAKTLADESGVPSQGPGSVSFEEGNVVDGLPYPDNTFDVVFSSQVIGHLPPPDMPLRALAEMRRVLKPGGILATRDGMGHHFYPQSLDLDRLWGENQLRASRRGAPETDPTATMMPALLRRAGFDADGGKVRVGASASVFSEPEARQRLAWRADGQLQKGDPFYQTWVDAGISEEEIQQTLDAIRKWAETEDAWLVILQSEMLAWK